MRNKVPKPWMLFTLILLLIQCLPQSAFSCFAETTDPVKIEPRYWVDWGTDYMDRMQEMCLIGNIEEGMEAEHKRNVKIETLGLRDEKISFMDLYLLSKIIMLEAGADWLPLSWKLAVGEVLLNRVNSPEFPDTIEDCIYAPGQYSSVGNSAFEELLPNYDSVIAAKRLLNGERVLNDRSVVFQANVVQGLVFLIMHDDLLGDTYFCKSSHLEYYP